MSTTTSGINGVNAGIKTPAGLGKSLKAKEALRKELNQNGECNYMIEIENRTFKLIVSARSQEFLNKLIEKLPDLKFQGIDIVTKVTEKILPENEW